MTDEERTQMKAAAIVEDLAIDADLANLGQVIDAILAAAPAAAGAAPVDPNELKTLITAISRGTASNVQNARFLELAKRVGL